MTLADFIACRRKRHAPIICYGLICLLVLLLILGSGLELSAGTKTWDGAGIPVSTNWTSAANWSGGVAPVAGDDLVFPSAAGRAGNRNDYAAGTIFNSISISSNNYAITGNTIALNDGISAGYLAGTSTFGPPLSLRSNQTFFVGERFNIGRFVNVLQMSGNLALNNHFATVDGFGTLQIFGVISGTGGLIKAGSGELQLSANNSYTGPTIVNGGTLLVNGAQPGSAVTVNSNSTLNGSGTIGALTVNSGIVAPGGNNPASFHVNGNLSLLTTGTVFQVLLAGTNTGAYDQLIVSGTVSLSSTPLLDITLAFQPKVGDTFTLIQNAGAALSSGVFAISTGTSVRSLSQGATFTINDWEFQINYRGGSGNDVVLTTTFDPLGPIRKWSGAGADPYWTTAANWAGGVAPPPGAALLFPSGASRLVVSNDFPVGTSFGPVTFTRGDYRLFGNAISVSFGIYDLNPAILSHNTIFSELQLGSATTFFCSNTADLALSGPISGAGGIIKQGRGVLDLINASSNTYLGSTIMAEGLLRIGGNGPLLSGPLFVGDGVFGPNGAFDEVQLSDNADVAVPVVITNSGSLFIYQNSSNKLGSLSGNGNIQFSQVDPGYLAGVLVVGGNDDSTVFAGSTIGPGDLLKIGAGTLTLSGTCSNSSSTRVVTGRLQVDGTIVSCPTILDGGTLSGTGQVANIVGGTGGTISPGAGPGILTCSNVTLNASTSYQVEINGPTLGTQYDQLNVRGLVDLGGCNLDVKLGYTPKLGETFVIMNNDGTDSITGTFAGLAEGALISIPGGNLQVSYAGGTGNDVTLLTLVTNGTGTVRVWDGGGANDYWSTPANWVGDNAPATGDDLEFPAAAAKFTSINDFLAPFGSLSFSGSGYSLSGSNISLATGITVNSGVNAIASPIRLLLPQSFSSVNPSATLLLSGPIDNNGHDLTLQSLGAINLTGPLLGSAALIKDGSGFVQLAVSNSYSGPTEIREGTVQLLNSYGLGSAAAGTTVMPAGRLSLQPGLTVAEALSLSGTLAMDAGSATCSGPIALPGGSNARIEVGAGLLTASAMISGDGGFTKAGAGALALMLNNTYLGPTEVEAGTLQVLGVQPGSAVNIHPGALLVGTGTVGALSCAGTVSPGISGPGTLRIAAGALLSSSATYQVELNGLVAGDQHDQLKINGQVQIQNASLRITAGFTPATGTSFSIIDNDGSDAVVGNFSGLPEGAILGVNGLAFQITYAGGTGNDVVLTRVAVPKPTILAIDFDASRHIVLQAKGIAQFDYSFEASSNLVSWASIGAAHSNDNGDFGFTDPSTNNVPQRFYRVRAP